MQAAFTKAFREMGATKKLDLERAVLEGKRRIIDGHCTSLTDAVTSVRGELPWLFEGGADAPVEASVAAPAIVQQPVAPTANASVASAMVIEKVEIKAVKKAPPKPPQKEAAPTAIE